MKRNYKHLAKCSLYTFEQIVLAAILAAAFLVMGYASYPILNTQSAYTAQDELVTLVDTDTLTITQDGAEVVVCDIIGGVTYTLATQTKLNLAANGGNVSNDIVASTLADSETVCIMSAQGVILIVDKTIGEYYLLYNS